MWWIAAAVAAPPLADRPIALDPPGVALSVGVTDDGPGWLIGRADDVAFVGPSGSRALADRGARAVLAADVDGDGAIETVGCDDAGVWVAGPTGADPWLDGVCGALAGRGAVLDGAVVGWRDGATIDDPGLVDPVLVAVGDELGWGERGGLAWSVRGAYAIADHDVFAPLLGAAWDDGWWFAAAPALLGPFGGPAYPLDSAPTWLGAGDVDVDGAPDLIVGASDGVAFGAADALTWLWFDDVVAVAVGDGDGDGCDEIGVLTEGGAALVVIQAVCPTDYDRDGDGSPAGMDCDDTDADVHPGATEDCDGVDQDCDGHIDEWSFASPAARTVDEGADVRLSGATDGCAGVEVRVEIVDDPAGACGVDGPDAVCTFPDQGGATVRWRGVGGDGLTRTQETVVTAVNVAPRWVGATERRPPVRVREHVVDPGDDVVSIDVVASDGDVSLDDGVLTTMSAFDVFVTLRLADEDGGASEVTLTLLGSGDTGDPDAPDDTDGFGPGCGESEPVDCGCGSWGCLLSPLLVGWLRRRLR